jgi:hypothetical protein
MLQRRESYSSVSSEPDAAPPMLRRSSSSSLTERRFRKAKPSDLKDMTGGNREHGFATTMRKPRKEGKMKRSRSSGNVLPKGAPRNSAPPPASAKRLSLSSDSSGRGSGWMVRQFGEGGVGEYADSVGSFASDLDSIPEDKMGLGRLHGKATRRWSSLSPEPPLEEEDDDDDGRRARERKRTLDRFEIDLAGEIGRNENKDATTHLAPPPSDSTGSPTRAHFGHASIDPVKHSPPARSVSPTKSALKRPASPMMPPQKVPGDTPSSTASDHLMDRRRCVRVSFSDEESITSFANSNSRPPPVQPDELEGSSKHPVFGGAKRSLNGEGTFPEQNHEQSTRDATKGTSISSLSSSDEYPDHHHNHHRYYNNSEVPQLVVLQPTPVEEIPEQTLTPPPEHTTAPINPSQPPGAFPSPPPSEPDTSESDNDSLYSDAYEVLPSQPQQQLPSIAETLSAPRRKSAGGANGRVIRPPSPPLPPEFSKPTPQPSRRRSLTPPPPRRRTNSSAAAAATTTTTDTSPRRITARSPSPTESESSFQRERGRRRRPALGFRSTMRTALPEVGARGRRSYSNSSDEGGGGSRIFGGGRGRVGVGTGSAGAGGWKSRFEDSSDDDEAAAAGNRSGDAAISLGGKLRKKGKVKKSGFWGGGWRRKRDPAVESAKAPPPPPPPPPELAPPPQQQQQRRENGINTPALGSVKRGTGGRGKSAARDVGIVGGEKEGRSRKRSGWRRWFGR